MDAVLRVWVVFSKQGSLVTRGLGEVFSIIVTESALDTVD